MAAALAPEKLRVSGSWATQYRLSILYLPSERELPPLLQWWTGPAQP